jgi:hypothetical protein
VEIGAEAALFPEKEYINGIFVAVWFGSGSRSISIDFALLDLDPDTKHWLLG